MEIKVDGNIVGTANWDRMGELMLETRDRVNDVMEIGKFIYAFGEFVMLWQLQGELWTLNSLDYDSKATEMNAEIYKGTLKDFLEMVGKLL